MSCEVKVFELKSERASPNIFLEIIALAAPNKTKLPLNKLNMLETSFAIFGLISSCSSLLLRDAYNMIPLSFIAEKDFHKIALSAASSFLTFGPFKEVLT